MIRRPIMVAAGGLAALWLGECAGAATLNSPLGEVIQRVLSPEGYSRFPTAGPAEDAGEEAALRAEILRGDAMQRALLEFAAYFATSAQFDEAQAAEFYATLGETSSGELRLFLRHVEQARSRSQADVLAEGRLRAPVAAAYRGLARAPGPTGTGGPRAASGHFLAYGRYFGPLGSGARLGPPHLRYYYVQPPLITSLDVARVTVWREFWGHRWHRR